MHSARSTCLRPTVTPNTDTCHITDVREDKRFDEDVKDEVTNKLAIEWEAPNVVPRSETGNGDEDNADLMRRYNVVESEMQAKIEVVGNGEVGAVKARASEVTPLCCPTRRTMETCSTHSP